MISSITSINNCWKVQTILIVGGRLLVLTIIQHDSDAHNCVSRRTVSNAVAITPHDGPWRSLPLWR